MATKLVNGLGRWGSGGGGAGRLGHYLLGEWGRVGSAGRAGSYKAWMIPGRAWAGPTGSNGCRARHGLCDGLGPQ